MAEVSGGWKPEYDFMLPLIDSNYRLRADGTAFKAETGLIQTPAEAAFIQHTAANGVVAAIEGLRPPLTAA